MWSMQQTEQSYNYTFEGKRNLLVCSISRFDEFVRLSEELQFLKDFDVKCFPFIGHNQLIVSDSEGFVSTYLVVE